MQYPAETAIKIAKEDESFKYAKLCDAICRIYFAERYNIGSDSTMHTSDAARIGATAAVEALLQSNAMVIED